MKSCAEFILIVTKLSNKGFTLTPKKIHIDNKILDAEVVKSINKTWNVKEFDKIKCPIIVGSVKNKAEFAKLSNRAQDCVMKFPGSEIKIPDDFSLIKDDIQQIIDFEYSINDQFDSYYMYLTLDHTFVKKDVHRDHLVPMLMGYKEAHTKLN